jgi:hypothetical protein
MKMYRFAITIAVFLVSAVVTVQAAPKQLGTSPELNSRVDVSVNQPNTVSGKLARVSIRTPRLSRRVRAKLAKMLSTGCRCALAEDDFAFNSCLGGCLASWGVSTTTLLACGGFCVGAGTGNPVGIALCAGCLGTAEWVVAGCAMYCAWGGGRHAMMLDTPPEAKLHKRLAGPSGT